MQLEATETDYVSEILALLVAFTKTRRQVLLSNLRNTNTACFSPQDLAVDEFSETVDNALSECLLHERIVLIDTDTIHFGPNMGLELEPVADPQAQALLQCDRQGYVTYQTKKLLENALNEKLALKLLNSKPSLSPGD